MSIKSLIQTEDWNEIKAFTSAEIIDKPMSIKTDGKSIESIALEVRASQIAVEKIKKAFKKLDRLNALPKKEALPFR
jgi:hypothetical protein